MHHPSCDCFLPPFIPLLLPSALQVPLLEEQKQCFRGVQHIHRETPVHRERPPLCPASTKLYLVSAAGSGWVRKKNLDLDTRATYSFSVSNLL